MLYSRPDIYDLLYNGFEEDIPFYRDLAEAAPGPVCELACGTGRVTVPLAMNGTEIVGIDASPEMIHAAEERARNAGVPAGRIAFAEGDMRYPPDDGRFGLTIIPLHSLSHLHGNDDVRTCLGGIHNSLRKDGRLVFAVHNPDPAVLARDPEEVFRIHPGIAGVAAYESSRYDSAGQLLDLSWFVETAGGTERFAYTLRMFFPLEMVSMLECSGFRVEQRYGWYDGTPFTEESGTHILVASKA
jgi:SAM-dependent methyltransferase